MLNVRRTKGAGLVAVVAASLFVAAPSGAAGQPTSTPVAASTTTRATQAQQNSIFRLYRAYFLRNADQQGLAHWVDQYSSGRMSLAAISDFFARSDEFRKRYGSLSDVEFVRLVYLNVLGRLPDQTGANHWATILRQGAPRGQIMIGFSESIEFQQKTGTQIKPVDPGGTGQTWADQLLARLNSLRAQHGLKPLKLCPPLTRAAQGHSDHQARTNRLSHQGANGSQPDARIHAAGYHWMAWGENVAHGQVTVEEVMAAWEGSASHRDNLLNPRFEHVGFGRTAASDGRFYWTQDFGAGGTC